MSMSAPPGTSTRDPNAVTAFLRLSSRMSRKRMGGWKLRSMYACLKGCEERKVVKDELRSEAAS